MCAAAGCALRPLHEIGYLSIDASDLEADPAHKGLLILTRPCATAPLMHLLIRTSSSRSPIRWIEWWCDGFGTQGICGGTADLESGIRPNAEVMVKLFIDASATTQAGYRVYLFYP